MSALSRQRLLHGGALALSASALAGDATARGVAWRAISTTSTTQSVTQLSFWGGWTRPDGLAMQQLVRRFNAETPDVQVTLTLYNWDLIFDRWKQEFDGGAPPDIVGIHATEVAEYAARGMLRDITPQAARHGLRAADFFAPAWRLCQVRHGLYAIPLDIHPLALYINAQAAKRAGLDVRWPPHTAADLLHWALRLTERGSDRWGYAAPAGDVECFRQWYSLLYQFGGRFLNPGLTRCLADSAAGVAAYAFLRDMVYRYRVAMPQESVVDADFIAGKVLMYLQGPWYISGVQQAGLPFITAPAPRIGRQSFVWANSHVLGVVNTLDQRRIDAAARFIAWITDHALDWAEAGQVPASNAARQHLPGTRIWPHLRAFASQVPNIVYQPNSRAHSQIFAETLPTPVITAMQAVMLGHETPREAVHVMAEEVDQILSDPAITDG